MQIYFLSIHLSCFNKERQQMNLSKLHFANLISDKFLSIVFIYICWFSHLKQRRRLITHANAKSKSEKFPPPHQDGAVGFPVCSSQHIDPTILPPDVPFSSTSFSYSKEPIETWSGPLVDNAGGAARRKKHSAGDTRESSISHRGSTKEKYSGARKGKKSIA